MKKQETKKPVRTPWTRKNMQDCIKGYNKMLKDERAEKKYNKAATNRLLVEKIGKTRGSIEMFMCNISAARLKQKLDFIKGYKPMPNYNKMLDELIKGK